MHVKQAVPFFAVANIEASSRWYIERLGFTMKLSWRPEGKLEWCWLEIGDAALMLQEYHKPMEGTLGLGVNICFVCDDAIAFYREAKARGVDAKRPSVGNGMWVTSMADPDGYQLYFESVTDAPEESELEE
ncbi:MAG TPA: VOC family protein [Thermoanaerobaculia bacterium]|nr:VOC family protein [Thermoanaerobaculia bacterium]